MSRTCKGSGCECCDLATAISREADVSKAQTHHGQVEGSGRPEIVPSNRRCFPLARGCSRVLHTLEQNSNLDRPMKFHALRSLHGPSHFRPEFVGFCVGAGFADRSLACVIVLYFLCHCLLYCHRALRMRVLPDLLSPRPNATSQCPATFLSRKYVAAGPRRIRQNSVALSRAQSQIGTQWRK